MSFAYHTQSDDQTEVLNCVIEQYLWAFVHRHPSSWERLLLWVEWSHNTSWNVGTGSTLYEITFGRKPFHFPGYITGTSKVDVVDDMLVNRKETFQVILKKLLKAQTLMKQHVDAKRMEVNYQPSDWVMRASTPPISLRQTASSHVWQVSQTILWAFPSSGTNWHDYL